MLENSFVVLKEIGTLSINPQEEMRFSIDAYHGFRYVSVRRYLRMDSFAGPTRDGVTLTPEIVQALVPRLLALPTQPEQIKLGMIGKFAKRAGICIVASMVEFRAERGLELRQWEQEKGYTKKSIFLPIKKWEEIRNLFKSTLAAIEETPQTNW